VPIRLLIFNERFYRQKLQALSSRQTRSQKMSKRKDKDIPRVHFIRSSTDEGKLAIDRDVSIIPSIASMRRQYEERLTNLADGLMKILKDLQNDKVILQMDRDINTAPHVKERILEIIKEALRSGKFHFYDLRTLSKEQETVIQRLIEELSRMEKDLQETSSEFSRCQGALKQESSIRADLDRKVSQLKLKIKDLVATQTKNEGTKVNDLYDKVVHLEKELSNKENELKKKKKALSQ